ncbi:MAG TPA: DHHA1 domain-containing protein, partial [Allocoleopsis sp.]
DKIAKGSARSVNDIDLYQLIFSQRYLLEKFGGHPLAAGLSIKEENIPVFTDAINQQLRKISLVNGGLIQPSLKVDLVVKVNDLGRDLYRELKYLEPCGMGNHTPKLLIKNCWFDDYENRNIKDFKGRKVKYIRTTFKIWDDSVKNKGFDGIWWGHYEYELPRSKCDAVVELDYNNNAKNAEIQVRLIAVNPISEVKFEVINQPDLIVDWRGNIQNESDVKWVLKEYPNSWDSLRLWLKKQPKQEKLAIAYPPPNDLSPAEIWLQLIGIAKYVSRTGKLVSIEQIKQKLQVSDRAVLLGLNALNDVGFKVIISEREIEIFFQGNADIILDKKENINLFLNIVREEQFYQRYFYEMPLSMIQGILFNEQLTMNN